VDSPRTKTISVAIAALMGLIVAQAVEAQYQIDSKGLLPNVIVFNGVEGAGEWTGTTSKDLDPMHPLNPNVLAFHKADGIYLKIHVADASYNDLDEIRVYFDIDNSGGMTASPSDWGVLARRGGGLTARWGPADNPDPDTWPGTPGSFGRNSVFDGWTIEFKLPTGPMPANLALSAGTIGIYFQILDYNVLNSTDPAVDPNAGFLQWPAALENLDTKPGSWGDYIFDPTTTFPDIAVTGIHNTYSGAENYYTISKDVDNTFQVLLNNPGGTEAPTPSNVRLNLYLAAIGIGEPWHRIDVGSVINDDCAAAIWASTQVDKTRVCAGATAHPDISAATLADVVHNVATYTIKNGSVMQREGGQSMTVPVGASTNDVLTWNTTAAQDGFFTQVVVNGTTYRRQHECMMAEAIIPNDPNTANNWTYRNMDFVCAPGGMMMAFEFGLGWAGFMKYDPQRGDQMYLRIARRNMNPQLGWQFQMAGAEQIGRDVYRASVRGTTSSSAQARILAPRPALLGRTLKENLLVPANAGSPPLYVLVRAGTRVSIVNYAFDDRDVQYVDLDSARDVPRNGPEGLSLRGRDRFFKSAGPNVRLLAPGQAPGALVGSFDNFATAFPVGDGVEVTVPRGATFLALAINDATGAHGNNAGPGFRVKVVERTVAAGSPSPGSSLESESWPLTRGPNPSMPRGREDEVQQAVLQLMPIQDVAPRLCIEGYASTRETRNISGKAHMLYRYIGNVCWMILNVYPPDRSQEPDRGDVFTGGQPGQPGTGPTGPGCGSRGAAGFGVFIGTTLLGIMIVGLRPRRRRQRS